MSGKMIESVADQMERVYMDELMASGLVKSPLNWLILKTCTMYFVRSDPDAPMFLTLL